MVGPSDRDPQKRVGIWVHQTSIDCSTLILPKKMVFFCRFLTCHAHNNSHSVTNINDGSLKNDINCIHNVNERICNFGGVSATCRLFI